jgi:hypothetical protein
MLPAGDSGLSFRDSPDEVDGDCEDPVMVFQLRRRVIATAMASAMLVLGLFSVGGSTALAYSCGSYCTFEAGWNGNPATQIYGIDGYINGTLQTGYSGEMARANWINICNNSCTQWVQTGECQGWCGGSGPYYYSAEHVFVENSWNNCSYYTYNDYGTPDAANEAYYLSSTGNSYGFECGVYTREYQFVMKKGSWSNPATTYVYLPKTNGQAISKTELHSANTTPPPDGTDYYGADNSGNPYGPNGIHVQTALSGSWVGWDSTSDPNGTYNTDSPHPVLHTPDHYWSFYTD